RAERESTFDRTDRIVVCLLRECLCVCDCFELRGGEVFEEQTAGVRAPVAVQDLPMCFYCKRGELAAQNLRLFVAQKRIEEIGAGLHRRRHAGGVRHGIGWELIAE